MNGQFFKIIARFKGFVGGGASPYRIMDIRTGEITNTTVGRIYNDLGEKLFAGRCFVPTAVDYPIISLFDGDQYKIPVIDSRTGECVENDKVIIIAELVNGNHVIGYQVTDYAGGLTNLDLREALNYANVGFWNGKVEGQFIKPFGNYVFPRLSV